MCGFAGLYNESCPSTSGQINNMLTAMGSAIVHRGPDDQGVWLDENSQIGFSHQRLSIIKLSDAGHQPMNSICGRYVLAYNGEIYNHLFIRALLVDEAVEMKWRGHSDTETLLAAISVWGVDKTLNEINGMFAFGLWDKQDKVLTLARDRMGGKPLYYGWQINTFLFSSEPEA